MVEAYQRGEVELEVADEQKSQKFSLPGGKYYSLATIACFARLRARVGGTNQTTQDIDVVSLSFTHFLTAATEADDPHEAITVAHDKAFSVRQLQDARCETKPMPDAPELLS